MLISIVLPQFHPIPENDAWWGKGFTEWRNVVKAQPLYKGHHQPQLPSDLGFYDLRLPQARAAQAELAREYGIGGFCYYHYWFHGRRLLEQPVEAIRASGQPDFPYCLAWANENWTRAWNGRDREVLMAQRYSPEDNEAHIRTLLPHFRDARYIRIDGKPLFVVYKADQLPDPQATFGRWREIAREEGVGELMLAQFEWSGDGSGTDVRAVGLDLSIEFAPDWRHLGGQHYTGWKSRLAMQLGLLPKAFGRHSFYDYQRMVDRVMAKPAPAYPFLRCVSPGFDNSARRPKGATVLMNSSPDAYRRWLESALLWTRTHQPADRQVVFINAWNEWAEGNHLEPDTRHGRAYLEATRDALLTLRDH
ncbi:glycoside hydrolase family 99-like domain-containing protein [Roseateles sp. YR242]|uniref:glycoside hydrolase family 99-like domain-containing protein n=1 Tax=Roseateles sp. YR242 TaxID=1855305 RepID=UPI001C431745|nr:glycoside hydrolase family 99-like domain-containing protein [Roseateles sp. YR242]